MKSISRTILIGYDGTDQGEDALALGAVLAEALDAAPLVVDVVTIAEQMIGPENASRVLREVSEPVLAVAKDRLGLPQAETRALLDSSAARALHDLAESEAPLVTVVGSTHRGRLGRVLPGSTGQNLLAGAPAAVAVAPLGWAAKDERSLLRIGVAVDGTEEAQRALEAGVALARRLNAKLTLLCVVEILPSAFSQSDVLSPEEYATASEQAAIEVLDRAAQRVPSELTAEQRLLGGDAAELMHRSAAEAIAESAADLDLLIVGSRGYGPVRRVLLGSVSAKLMQLAPCPVLVLPRQAGDDPLGLADRHADGK